MYFIKKKLTKPKKKSPKAHNNKKFQQFLVHWIFGWNQ